jgi:hypothetical protein
VRSSGLSAARRTTASAAAAGGARIQILGPPVTLRLWQAASSNQAAVVGRVTLGGRSVTGARVSLDGYLLPSSTGKNGEFSADVDATLAQRHVVRVVDASHATVQGHAVSASQRSALSAASGGISVGYRIVGAHATVRKDGTVKVTGRALRADDVSAPSVVQLSYRLQGTITDAAGNPVEGATVVTRTTDRDFWTFSQPSNAQGHYVSFFAASDEAGDDPVPLSVQVASGRKQYLVGPVATTNFKQLSSATLNLKLPGSGTGLSIQPSTPDAGAYYRGILIGVRSPHGVVAPLSAAWPDARGNFSLVLPKLKRGTPLLFWENDAVTFSTSASRPGGAVAANAWPKALTQRVSTGFSRITVGS